MPRMSRLARPAFDPEGSDYDMETAVKRGLKPAGPEAGPNEGHWGSVVETTSAERKKHKLPAESYKLLKGRSHEKFYKAVAGEEARGFVVKKFGSRYYSVPK